MKLCPIMGKSSELVTAGACIAWTLSFINLSSRTLSLTMVVAVSPLCYLISHYMAGGHVLNSLILTTFWTTWMVTLFAPFYLLVGKYIILSMYFPLGVLFSQKIFGRDSGGPPNSLFLLLETLFWDMPLLIWINLIAMTGSRALPPFMNVIVENRAKLEACNYENNFLIIGSLPLARDVEAIMTKSPYNVGCVVNMCREYAGPENEYMRCGVTQFHAKTPDMCEPTYSDVIDCVSFLRLFRNNKKNANKRALIHCKGGRSRSACIALCYFLSTGQYTIDEAWKTIKASRTIADRGIKTMVVVKKFEAELAECEGSFERLQLMYVSKGIGSQAQKREITASLRKSRPLYRPSPPSSPSHSNSPGAGRRKRTKEGQPSMSPLLR